MYDLGYLAGSIVFGAIAVLGAVIFLFGMFAKAGGEDDGAAVGCGGLVGFIVGAIIFTIIQFPFNSDYHKYNTYSGTVDQVASRVLPAGDKQVEQKFVVRFKDSDQEYGCLDTRCALVKPGDHLTLSCIKEWEWAGTDGFDCHWGKNVPAKDAVKNGG